MDAQPDIIFNDAKKIMYRYFVTLDEKGQQNFKDFELLWDPHSKRLMLNVNDLYGDWDTLETWQITYTKFLKIVSLFKRFHKSAKFKIWSFICLRVTILF